MRSSEYILIALLFICAWQLLRNFRKTLIMRHVFIVYSDWCANEIKSICDEARDEIVELALQSAQDRCFSLKAEDALGYVPDTIRTAQVNWLAQKERLQHALELNGMRALNLNDLDALVLSNPSWFKRVPLPQRVSRV